MWTTPKTGWVPENYFNASDYNRIVDNIQAAYDFSLSLYNKYDLGDMMINADYESIPHADNWNAITNNIKRINEHTYNLALPENVTYLDNAKSPNYEEFNRWESAINLLMTTLRREASAINRFEFTLGRKSLGTRL